MERDVLRHAQAQKEALVDGFLRDLVGQLRTLVYEATTDVLASIQTQQRLGGKSATQLRHLVGQVGRLNFFGDAELDAAIGRLEALIAPPAPARDLAELQAALQATATVTRAVLLDLGQAPRSARALGVADTPTPALLRRARRALGLPDAAAPAPLPLARGRRA